MLIPTKRQMRDINERGPDIAKSLFYWREEATRLQLFKGAQAITEAIRIFVDETEEARHLFHNSGRRRRGKG